MELSKTQEEILDLTDDIIFVDAAAASGKSHCIIERTRREVEANKGLVVSFTFTTMAAEELIKRIGEFDRSRLFVGTIHSFCLYILLSHGYDEANIYINDENFDGLFELVKKYPDCIPPIYSIMCDEMQDCNADQFEFIFNMLRAKRYFCAFDKKQTLYKWRDAMPEYIDDYAQKLNANVVSLNENYRNGNNILDFAKRIIRPTGMIDKSMAMREENGIVTEAPFDLNIIIFSIEEDIKDFGLYKNWAILTRTNKEIDEIITVLNSKGIPTDTFKQGGLTRDELTKKMNDNTVKVLTVHSAKGLEWDNVVVIGMRFAPSEERNVCYVAATRARNHLYWITGKKKKTQKMKRW